MENVPFLARLSQSSQNRVFAEVVTQQADLAGASAKAYAAAFLSWTKPDSVGAIAGWRAAPEHLYV
jgi:hypothetical protein